MNCLFVLYITTQCASETIPFSKKKKNLLKEVLCFYVEVSPDASVDLYFDHALTGRYIRLLLRLL